MVQNFFFFFELVGGCLVSCYIDCDIIAIFDIIIYKFQPSSVKILHLYNIYYVIFSQLHVEKYIYYECMSRLESGCQTFKYTSDLKIDHKSVHCTG